MDNQANKRDRTDEAPENQAAGDGNRGETATAAPDASEIERLRTDLEEANDRILRAQADLENYRKRARRELEDERKFASLPLLRDLLPVIDNLQRAMAAAEKTPEAANLLEGIRMVAQNLDSVLGRHHVRRIDALQKPFDPAFHEAIAQQPNGEFPEHTVMQVVQDGYTLHDRVVRPAQVIVSTIPQA